MKSNVIRQKWAICLATLAVLGAGAGLSAKTSPAELAKNDPDLKQREYMLEIGRQLGVTCNYCHNLDNLKDPKLKTYPIARNHIRMVEEINRDPKKRLGVKIDCFMCHRGHAIPDYKEPRAITE